MFQWESEEAFYKEMLDTGCIDDFELQDDGEVMVVWNQEVLREKFPDVYAFVEQQHLAEVEESLSHLVDQGLLSMAFQENESGEIEAVYSLTEEGKSFVEETTPEWEDFLREEFKG